ncbi:BZ3500_MvSof-1268-A1-R1_Chr1-1g01272 [Microbotryum saponariae]|uniref:BZ3500_MvSof-1268-A1-R1_Chr1-1g01272 protein n=1 Tax=Microbotryum saponariae TaxID=289078 RepID=A0A2X0K8Z1_9BASI|nr:BZ3500_MvSof-1268-A1-R1_Chr1-1g01272 [Microbotryum saponariae]SCZ93848.1 BZ3501_MvSof-1269-A2-R1_Chr1-1g00868 [Microbotryum saponariae]
MPQSVSGPTPTLCMYVVVSAGDPHRAFTELGYKKWFQLTLRDRDFRERLTFFWKGHCKVNVTVMDLLTGDSFFLGDGGRSVRRGGQGRTAAGLTRVRRCFDSRGGRTGARPH